MRVVHHRFKSLEGAVRRIRELEKQIASLEAIVHRYTADRRNLAKLAADGPCFDNPIVVAEVKAMRNAILGSECGLLPDGKFIPGNKR